MLARRRAIRSEIDFSKRAFERPHRPWIMHSEPIAKEDETAQAEEELSEEDRQRETAASKTNLDI